MNIKEMSVIELKALKCDEYEKIQIAQQNIQVINREIETRIKSDKKDNQAIESAISGQEVKNG